MTLAALAASHRRIFPEDGEAGYHEPEALREKEKEAEKKRSHEEL